MLEKANLLIDGTSLSSKLDFQASIVRYSDKYSKKSKKGDSFKWEPGLSKQITPRIIARLTFRMCLDWTRLPRELKFFQTEPKLKKASATTSAKRKAPEGKAVAKIKKEAMDYIDLDTLAKVLNCLFISINFF